MNDHIENIEDKNTKEFARACYDDNREANMTTTTEILNSLEELYQLTEQHVSIEFNIHSNGELDHVLYIAYNESLGNSMIEAFNTIGELMNYIDKIKQKIIEKFRRENTQRKREELKKWIDENDVTIQETIELLQETIELLQESNEDSHEN